jgi:ankyrin repeat protein
MDKGTLIAVGLLIMVIVVSLEWLRSGPSSDVPPEVTQRDIFIGSAGSGDMQTVLEMLEQGVDINVHASFGGPTALIVAARFGHVAIVEVLLERGAEVNAEDDYGQTALYFAKKNSKIKVVELLEAAGGTSPPVEKVDAQQPLSDV